MTRRQAQIFFFFVMKSGLEAGTYDISSIEYSRKRKCWDVWYTSKRYPELLNYMVTRDNGMTWC